MGLWIAFTFEFIVRIWIMRHIMRLNKNRTEKILSLTILFVIATVTTIWTLWAEWFLYWFKINRPTHNFEPEPEWLIQVIDKCDDITKENVIFVFAKN